MSRLKIFEPDKLWFGYCSFLIIWIWDSYFEIYKFFKEGVLFARVLDGHPYISDTVQWYNAAVLAYQCAGGKFNIYDPVKQDQGIREIVKPVVPEGYLYLQYPPQFFPLVQPFALFPIGVAYFVWCGLALASILFVIWFVAKDTTRSTFGRVLIYVATLGSFPAWLSFELAQTSLFQFPFTLGFWLLVRSRRFFLAGLLSALLMVKVQYSPPILLVGLLLGRGRYLLGLALSGAILALATVASVGWENITRFPEALAFGETSTKVTGVSIDKMQNFRGQMVALWGADNSVIHILTLLMFAAGMLVIGWLWLRVYPKLTEKIGGQAFNYLAAFTVLISLIVSPHTHIQEYLSATISILFFYPLAASRRKERAGRALYFLLLFYPVWSWLFYILLSLFHLVRLQPYFLWAIVVLALAAVLTRRQAAES